MAKIDAILIVVALSACATGDNPPKAIAAKQVAPAWTAHATRVSDDQTPVIIASEVIEGFQFLYRFISETEFVLCLEGSDTNGRIHVTSFRLARIKTTTANSVEYHPCTAADYVGTAHNHPPKPVSDAGCYQSLPDRVSFRADPRATVDIVLCGEGKYLWVLKDGRSRVEGATTAMN